MWIRQFMLVGAHFIAEFIGRFSWVKRTVFVGALHQKNGVLWEGLLVKRIYVNGDSPSYYWG